jgi:hypothetical protein
MMRHPFRLLILGLLVLGGAASAQQTPALRDDVALEDYLATLAQITPAAREAAETYLEAHRARCGRTLPTLQLRRAFAEGSGDPVLLAMVRAAYLRDAGELQRLRRAVTCRHG